MAYVSRSNVVIPDQYVQAIIQEAVTQSAVMSQVRRVPMATGVEKLPVLATLPGGGWVSPRDTGLKTTSSAEWEDVTLTAEELAVIVPIPEAVIADANYDLFGEIRPRVGERFGQLIDLAVLFGVDDQGASVPATFPTGGILQHAVDAGNERAATGDIDIVEDINQTMAAVEDDGFEAANFVAASTLKSRLRGLRDKNNNPILTFGGGAGSPASLYGQPITYSRNGGWVPDEALLITGDFSKAILAIRQDMTMKVLDQAVISDADGKVVLNLAQQDMVALRCVMRVGFALANPVTVQNATKAGRSPFAVLRPAA